MIYIEILVSICTMLSYWLLTHSTYRTYGLWATLGTECLWMSMFGYREMWGLMPISIVMFIITTIRLREVYMDRMEDNK